jgi:hypothetical protein
MDVEPTGEQPAATPAAAATRTARRVRFETTDDTAAGAGRTIEQGSNNAAALLDWCCPDLEALLGSMPAVQRACSSNSSCIEVQSGDDFVQHATLCR